MEDVQEKKIVFVCYTLSSKPYSVELLTLGCYKHNFVLLNTRNVLLYFFYVVLQPIGGLWPPHSRGFRDHTYNAPQSVGLLWTSDQSVAETFT
jgi:hypothetical protein